MVGLPQIAIVFNELLNAFSFFSGNDKEHALVCVKPDWSARLGRPRTNSDSGHSTKDRPPARFEKDSLEAQYPRERCLPAGYVRDTKHAPSKLDQFNAADKHLCWARRCPSWILSSSGGCNFIKSFPGGMCAYWDIPSKIHSAGFYHMNSQNSSQVRTSYWLIRAWARFKTIFSSIGISIKRHKLVPRPFSLHNGNSYWWDDKFFLYIETTSMVTLHGVMELGQASCTRCCLTAPHFNLNQWYHVDRLVATNFSEI